MKVIILKRKVNWDEEWEVCGVFSNKTKVKEYKKWFKENYPILYKDSKWEEDLREVDKNEY